MGATFAQLWYGTYRGDSVTGWGPESKRGSCRSQAGFPTSHFHGADPLQETRISFSMIRPASARRCLLQVLHLDSSLDTKFPAHEHLGDTFQLHLNYSTLHFIRSWKQGGIDHPDAEQVLGKPVGWDSSGPPRTGEGQCCTSGRCLPPKLC